jgi:hypothetical protein
MSDDDRDDPVDMGNLELFEGDVSMVVRADGEVEFLIASEEEDSEDYLRSLHLVHYLKFVLEDEGCKRLFEDSLSASLN